MGDVVNPAASALAMDGVGDLLSASGLTVWSETVLLKRTGLSEDGMGVETPSALASLARRSGARGVFGLVHVGDNADEAAPELSAMNSKFYPS